MKILTFILCLVLVLFGHTVRAQAPLISWQTCVGGFNYDEARSIEPTADGGYILIAWTNSAEGDLGGLLHSPFDPGDAWIVKLNSAGVIQWSKEFGGDWGEIGQCIRPTPDGGFIATVTTASSNGDAVGNHGGQDCLLLRLNSTGGILWEKCIGGEGNDQLQSLQLTPDGGYILAGSTTSVQGNFTSNHGLTDFWVVKIDGTGNILWQKCYGGTKDEEARSVGLTPDGGYMVSGYSSSNDGDVSGFHGQTDVWVVKLSSSGVLQWQKCYGGTSGDQGYGMVTLPDGGCVIDGVAFSNDGDVSGNHDFWPAGDLWAIRLDASGALVWQKCYGGTGPEIGTAVRATPDGGFLFGGSAASTDGDVTCARNSWDYWIVRTDAAGALLWEKTMGGSLNDMGLALSLTPDGGAIMAGSTMSPNLPRFHASPYGISPADAYIVKLSPATISAPVAAVVDAPPASVCSGSTVTLKVNISNLSPVGYIQWIRNGLTLDINTTTYTASDFADGEKVYCRVYDLSDDCNPVVSYLSNTVTVHVSSAVKPTLSISADATTICSGSTTRFAASVVNGSPGAGYQWMVGGVAMGGNSPTFTPATLRDGDIVYCVYSDNGCDAGSPNASNQIRITVQPSVTPGLSIAAASTKLCSGEQAVFTATPVNGGSAPVYQWLVNGSPAGLPGSSPRFVSSSLADKDVVSCTLSGNAACSSVATAGSNQVTMTVNPSGTLHLQVDRTADPICSGKQVVFTASADVVVSSLSYQWEVDGKPVGNGGNTYTVNNLADGDVVSCKVVDGEGCMTPAAVSLMVPVYPNPVVGVVAPVVVNKGQAVVLDLQVTGDVSSYSWSPATGLSDPGVARPVFDGLASTDYSLDVSSPQGCTASGVLSVKVVSRLAVPGAFSPNGDGRNDIFYVIGGPLGSVVKDFLIFDRWGACVFQKHGVAPDDPAYGWDGRIAGQAAPVGTYVYQIRMGFADGTQQVIKGTVVLAR